MTAHRGILPLREIDSRVAGRLEDWVLSRVGEAPECSPHYRVYECSPCVEFDVRRWRCSQERKCRACSKLWAADEGRIAEHRLQRFRGQYPPRHVVVSPPEPLRSAEDPRGYQRVLTRSWALLKRMGVQGGVLIVHPWRKKIHAWGVEWYPSMHVHAVVYGRVDADKNERGWVVKTERFEQGSVAGTIAYLADHAGYVARGHVPHWYGLCSRRAGGPVDRLEGGKLRCSKGHEMIQVNEAPWDEDDVREYMLLAGRKRKNPGGATRWWLRP